MEFFQHTVLNDTVVMWNKMSKQFEKKHITQLEFRINKTSKNYHGVKKGQPNLKGKVYGEK